MENENDNEDIEKGGGYIYILHICIYICIADYFYNKHPIIILGALAEPTIGVNVPIGMRHPLHSVSPTNRQIKSSSMIDGLIEAPSRL